VLAALVEDRAFIATHLVRNPEIGGLGFLLGQRDRLGLAMLFVGAAVPAHRHAAAITMRNIPYVAPLGAGAGVRDGLRRKS